MVIVWMTGWGGGVRARLYSLTLQGRQVCPCYTHNQIHTSLCLVSDIVPDVVPALVLDLVPAWAYYNLSVPDVVRAWAVWRTTG
jgi:hypothetical protein